MKKLLSIALAAIMLFAIIPFSAVTVFADVDTWDGTASAFQYGSGTEDDPYLITSAEELAYFAKSVNSGNSYEGEYIKLTVDIKLNDETFTFDTDTGLIEVTDGTNVGYLGSGILGDTSGENSVFDTTSSELGRWYASKDSLTKKSYGGKLNPWSGIGKDATNAFSGNFDGGKHTVSGMYYVHITKPDSNLTENSGFFGYTKDAQIRNLGIINAYIHVYHESGGANDENYTHSNVGGIVGQITGGKIEDCYCSSSLFSGGSAYFRVSYNYTKSAVGGLIGYASNLPSIQKCYIDETFINAKYSSAGGIVGLMYNSSIAANITNCYTNAKINGSYSGGIVGSVSSPNEYSLHQCYTISTIVGTNLAGAIMGYPGNASNYKLTFQNCYYKMGCAIYNDTTIAQGVGNKDDISTKCKPYTVGNMQKQENYVGFDFDTVWYLNAESAYPYPMLYGMPFVDPSNCAHFYSSVISEPSCSESGFTTYSCKLCGYSYTSDHVSALGHSYEGTVTAPTCTEQGFTTYTCETCGDSYEDDFIKANGHSTNGAADCDTAEVCSVCGITVEAAKGHNYKEKVTAPTCTEQGYTTHTCETCGDSYKDTFVRANGHSKSESADCENDQICTTCGDVLVPAWGHNYQAVVTAPTCTERGYTTHTCVNCLDSYVDTYVAAGHTEGEAATCTKDQTCTVCGEILNKATGHTEGEAATCTKDQTCTVCGEILNKATGHTEGEWKTLDDGSQELRCTVCNELLDSKDAENSDIGLLGDINNDGKINQYDYILAKRIHFKNYTPTAEETARGDVNNDGKNDQYDYILIKRHHFKNFTIIGNAVIK